MALKFGPDKRKGERKRTVIDPRRGGKAGDAGPKFQREGAQPRTKITDSRISNSPNAGFSGSKKSIAPGSFKAAFAVALAKGPGTIFTFKGKKYKAIKKHEMKGPSASRVEDKKITKATIIKGKRDTTKSRNPVGTKKPSDKITSAQIKALNETFKRSAAGKVKKRKAPTPASGKFGQRKAGGIIKAKNGTLTDLAYAKAKAREEGGRFSVTDLKIAEASVNPTILKKAKELAKAREKGGRVSKSDIEMAKSILGKNKKRNLGQRKAGGMMKKYTKGGMNKYNKGSMLGDLDKDGVMSGYEQKRQDAITTAMGNKKMGGGMAKKKMMGGGMMQYNEGTGKKGVTVQARGCGQAVNKRKTRIT